MQRGRRSYKEVVRIQSAGSSHGFLCMLVQMHSEMDRFETDYCHSGTAVYVRNSQVVKCV